jgi:hypothetical protein
MGCVCAVWHISIDNRRWRSGGWWCAWRVDNDRAVQVVDEECNVLLKVGWQAVGEEAICEGLPVELLSRRALTAAVLGLCGARAGVQSCTLRWLTSDFTVGGEAEVDEVIIVAGALACRSRAMRCWGGGGGGGGCSHTGSGIRLTGHGACCVTGHGGR